MHYTKCDSPDEASAILEEARCGNPAAQYITGMALTQASEDGSEWIKKSADQGFKPALVNLGRLSA
jgi:hypothetical protein